ncbi:uncharacterized protein LOC141936785 [Strix uralensis]|uniref:uncharacterized protein LOC141936785 n=1 Tax=Strix uralensis TaxID=36305 RepID=UPI003DA752FB
MLRCGRPARGRRAPLQSTTEMEAIFLQLCEEVARLQDLCTKQGKLLQKLTARKGPVPDIPTSLPIQCTEDTVTEERERPPDSPQKRSEAPAPAEAGSSHAASAVPGFDGKYPPSAGVCGGGTGGAAPAVVFGSSKAERSGKVDVDVWLKTCRMFPTREEVRACCSPQELTAPNPAVGDSFLTLLDLYEAPETLRREDAPGKSALPAEAKVPVEIRGPVKTSWTPGWVLEDGTLGQGAVLAAEDAQTCDICQEIFPSGAAGQVDYLKHVLAHLK